MKPSLCSLAILLALASCGPAATQRTSGRTAQQEQLYQLIVDRPIVCRKGKDCDQKWAKATEWVLKYSTTYVDGRPVHNSLRSFSRNIIESGAKPLDTRFRITRLKQEDGSYKIDYSSACEQDTPCFEKVGRKMRMAFYADMIGLPPHVVRPSELAFGIDRKYLPPLENAQK